MGIIVGDILAWQRSRPSWRADCLALAEVRAADLLEYRAWLREGFEDAETAIDRVVLTQMSVKGLIEGAERGWL
jgi:hypothetical protein